MRAILAIVICSAFFLVVGFIDASGCVVRQRADVYYAPAYQPSYQHYQAPAVVTYYNVPVYSFGYASSDLELQVKNLKLELTIQRQEQIIREREQELKSFRQQLPEKQAEPLKAPPRKDDNHPFEEIMKNSCFKCHSASAVKDPNKEFVLHDGKGFLILTDRQIREMQKRIFSGNMPKGGKLTDQQVGEAMDWLGQQQSVEELASKKK